MKTIISIFLFSILFLFGCDDGGKKTKVITHPGPIIPVIPDPPIEYEPIQLALITGDTVKFYDGEQIYTYSENCKRAGSQVYSVASVLNKLDEYGNISESRYLVIDPDEITIKNYPASKAGGEFKLSESDTWIVEDISPDTAYSMGAQYKPYTRIYLNSAEYGNWFDNQYIAEKLIVHGDDIFARLSTGAFLHVNGDKENVRLVIENGFAIYDYNSTARTATIDGVSVSWTTNFFNGSDEWLKSGGVWYSQNGYTWDGSTLDESGSVLTALRSEQNLIIAVGTRYENSEDVLYFIQCATGHVIRYVPSVDQYIEFVRLYTGDGETETGTFYKSTLKPIINNDYLYFIFDAQVYRYDFVSGLTSMFTSGVSEIQEF